MKNALNLEADDILAIQRMIDKGLLKLTQVITAWKYGDYRFRVQGLGDGDIEFVFFNDAGDWDYLKEVYVCGHLIADYERMNEDIARYEEVGWYKVGRWLPNLPNWAGLETLEET